MLRREICRWVHVSEGEGRVDLQVSVDNGESREGRSAGVCVGK